MRKNKHYTINSKLKNLFEIYCKINNISQKSIIIYLLQEIYDELTENNIEDAKERWNKNKKKSKTY